VLIRKLPEGSHDRYRMRLHGSAIYPLASQYRRRFGRRSGRSGGKSDGPRGSNECFQLEYTSGKGVTSALHVFKIENPNDRFIQLSFLQDTQPRPCRFPLEVYYRFSSKLYCITRNIFMAAVENGEAE